MLYPISPEKVARFIERLNAASEAENLPRPAVHAVDASPEEMVAAASVYIEGARPADPVDGMACVGIKGRPYCLLKVQWPRPLRDKSGQMVLHSGNVPVGPDPTHMWQVLWLLPEP
jgi:hypothetical protein